MYSDDDKPPLPRKVNGYFVIQKPEGWMVWGDDNAVDGPFATEAEAAEAADQQRPLRR